MHLLDVAPTVLELLGLDVPESMRGRSLLGAPQPAPAG
jgi:bisphosphoglycerate-independent phosphoglycerate mutase (AlkP superfamily)